jgi:AMP phosphorylase
MKEIISEQGGDPNIKSSQLNPGKHVFEVKAERNCLIREINSKNLTLLARALGAPGQKKSGVYLNKKEGEKIEKDDTICTLYSENMYNLTEGKKTIKELPVFGFNE